MKEVWKNKLPNYKLYQFKSLTSTQDKAKEFAKKGFSNIVVVADAQTKGKGRFKRKWFSGKGGLWMSILLRPKNIQNLQYLTFAAAISVVESIKKTANLETKIKWPNDVHCKKKKLCGILTEGIFGKENYVIVGIGLNVNQERFRKEISEIATSLNLIKKRHFNIEIIMICILENFFKLYCQNYSKNKLDDILKKWKKYSDTVGKNVTVAARDKKIEGKAIGVDGECRLILKTKNGMIKIIEGDVRVIY